MRYSTSTSSLLLGLAALIPAGVCEQAFAQSVSLTLAGRERFLTTPSEGAWLYAFTMHSGPGAGDLMSCHGVMTRSDIADEAHVRFSSDNGISWSEPTAIPTHQQTSAGTLHRGYMPGLYDARQGVFFVPIGQAVLPTNDPWEGFQRWTVRYALSRDGGRTFFHEDQIIQSDGDYSAEHPLPGVWVGKNCYMLGDITCAPIQIRTGEILLPVQIPPIDPDGKKYHNPGGGASYTDCAVLIGCWNEEGTLDWRLSDVVRADASRTTRGAARSR